MVVKVERTWTSDSGPTPAAGQHFVRIQVRFHVLTGYQYVGAHSLQLLTSQPPGFGQPFGQGAGLDLPVPQACASPESILVTAGGESPLLPVCWQVPGPPEQNLSLQWSTNHGTSVTLSL